MSKTESEAPIRLPSAAQVKALLKEGARVKEKMSEIAGTYGDRVKPAIENGNLHGAAFGKAKSIYTKSRTNELAALEQIHHLRVYLEWIEEDIQNKGHVGDLDRMSQAAAAKQEEPQSAASAAAEAFAKEDAATEANRTEARKALDLDGDWEGAAPPAPPADAVAEAVEDKPKRGRKAKTPEATTEAAPPPPPPALKDDDEEEPSPTPRRQRAAGTATAIH